MNDILFVWLWQLVEIDVVKLISKLSNMFCYVVSYDHLKLKFLRAEMGLIWLYYSLAEMNRLADRKSQIESAPKKVNFG